MESHPRSKIIIDTDGGTDDAQAIFMALARSDVDVVAITTVFGNSSLENTSHNVHRMLKFDGRLDIPVYRGSGKSLTGKGCVSDGFHGNDGLGDVPDNDPVDEGIIQQEHAANALVRLAKTHPGEITLVTIGPLTNLAVALHIDPELVNKLRRCIVMGGNTEGQGNITPTAEFNFYSDPEAAEFVLKHFGRKITLFPLELCWKYSFSWEWYDKLIQMSVAKVQFIKMIEAKMVKNARGPKYNYPKYFAWDQLAMAAVIDHRVVEEATDVYCTVSCNGSGPRGQMTVDWTPKPNRAPNVSLVTAVNMELYEKLLYEGLDILL